MEMATFIDLVRKRRSIYALGTDSRYTKEEIKVRIREVIKHVPTAFSTARRPVSFYYTMKRIRNFGTIFTTSKKTC